MAASERVRSRVPAPQRSILPSVPGIPVGAAILIAVACTFLGFLIDASGGSAELTGTFAALYVLGCVAAVAAVRYRGLFSTMVLPPLLLFVAVPLAYQHLTGRGSTSLKDILLNLAIPLVNRFPTMMLATVVVLLIGGARIYLHRREEQDARPLSARRGESWGKSSAKKSRPARSSGGVSDPARRKARRPKKEPDELEVDESDEPAPRPARRPAAQVADTPPRVAPSRPREGRAPARGATRPTAAMPRPEGEPPRGAGRRREVPPHPQPNVRYRDSGRTERRRPENL
ncbi:hypothetical protein IU486_18735 [Streptomyces gardneri]|nr:hypothetical protein [Streptomyces gardneri]MBF6205300.1 hypothetical protein [Streptomyces gardneri]UAK35684.1 hypothetical protein K8O92_13815 [Nocardia asteroides]